MQGDRTVTTIFFDGQFWTALIERHDAGRCLVARHVFGAEPNNAELRAWACSSWRGLRFAETDDRPPYDPRRRIEDRRLGRI